MHENSGIQFLGELSHNKMKSLGKFNVEAKLRGVPNELRLMNSYANWEKLLYLLDTSLSKHNSQNIKAQSLIKTFYALASAMQKQRN